MTHLSATVSPQDCWTISIVSKEGRAEFKHRYTVESHSRGIRILLKDLYLIVNDNRIEVWKSDVQHGDYVDVFLGTIELDDYRKMKGTVIRMGDPKSLRILKSLGR